MAELVDALGSGSSVLSDVLVRLQSRAQEYNPNTVVYICPVQILLFSLSMVLDSLKCDHNHENDQFSWDSKTAKWYAAEYGDHISNDLTINNIALKKNDNLLDIGCGTGRAVRLAAKICTAGKVIGIDPTAAMVRIAQGEKGDNYSNFDFIIGSAEKIPLPDKSITIATAINSLHHWQDYKKGLVEIDRVLRQDGSFIITNDIVDNNTCGHGEGPLEKPEDIILILEQTKFTDISLKEYKHGEAGIYLISCKKP